MGEKKIAKTDVLSIGDKTVFLDFAYKGNKSGTYKTVFLDFVYKGNKYGIYFIVNRVVHEKLISISRSLIHGKGIEKITKGDFILPRHNNPLQREELLHLVEKIKSFTPDVHKQARIAISLVQNIPIQMLLIMKNTPMELYGNMGVPVVKSRIYCFSY